MGDLNELYNCFVEDNNMTYSIDKLRLKTYIDYNIYSNLVFYVRTYYFDNIKKFWISDRVMNFKYNWNIEIEEGRSFIFQFQHNSEKKDEHDGKFNFTIEFNPNKLKDCSLIKYILALSGNWFIRQYDLAIDLKINILDLILDNALKRRKDMHIFCGGFDNKSFEWGKNDGRTKVYNKKIESNLNILGYLTRVETTRCLEDYPINMIAFYNYGDIFPNIYTGNYMFSFSDYKDKTMLAILYAVQHDFPISELSRTYREKLKNMLSGGYKIKFSNKVANEVLRRTIFYYFIKNDLVIFK